MQLTSKRIFPSVLCSESGGYLWTDLKHVRWYTEILFPSLHGSISLTKVKSAREALEEQGLWEQYRTKYPFNPMAKFTQNYAVGYEPMTNDADVSSV